MLRPLIIIGTSGLAREIAFLVETLNALEKVWQFLGFIGEKKDEIGKDLAFGKVIGDDKWLLSQNFPADIAIGIGYPQIRFKVLSKYLKQTNRFVFPNLIHPHAVLDQRYVQLGKGNIVFAGCIFTCDIKIDDFNYFNNNVTIGHDVNIGNYNVINPGANISGSVLVDDRVLIGTGSQILEKVSIASDATVGAGAMVRTDVREGQTVVGVPARPLQKDPKR